VANLEVEDIGVQRNLLKMKTVLLRSKKGPSEHGFYIQNTGLHTQEVSSLFYGKGNDSNDFIKYLLDLSGERITKSIYEKDDGYSVSNLTFSNGNEFGPVRSDCSLIPTLLSNGRIFLDERMLETENKMKESFEEGKKRSNDFIRNLKSDYMRLVASSTESEIESSFERLLEYIEYAEFKPISNLTYKPEGNTPKIVDEDYLNCRVSNVSMALGPDGLGLVGKIENGGGIYTIPFPTSKRLIENVIKQYPASTAVLSSSKLKEEPMDCSNLIEHLLDKSKTDIVSVYVEALSRPSINIIPSLGPLGIEPKIEKSRNLEPVDCFVKSENGSNVKVHRVPYETGITIWSKAFDNQLKIKESEQR